MKFTVVFLLLHFVCFSNFSFATTTSPTDSLTNNTTKNYNYPIDNPYHASFTFPFISASKDFEKNHRILRKVEVLPDRKAVRYLEQHKNFAYAYYPQKKQSGVDKGAPLVYIFGGTGGNYVASYLGFLAEQFHKQGFQVVALAPAFSWMFQLQGGVSTMPGYTQDDALDMANAVKLIQRDVSKIADSSNYKKISKVGMIGISISGLELAYYRVLEEMGKTLPVDQYLLINPPVDLMNSLAELDSYLAAMRSRYSPRRQREIYDELMGRGAYLFTSGKLNRETIHKLPQYFNYDQSILAFMISANLQDALGDVIYVMESIESRDILRSQGRSTRLAEAKTFWFLGDDINRGYVNDVLLPHHPWHRENNHTLEQLNALASMKRLSAKLSKYKNISVMHNLDDFLLKEQDFQFLKYTFGDRLKLYPKGGHVGNIWYPQNVMDILQTFQGLR